MEKVVEKIVPRVKAEEEEEDEPELVDPAVEIKAHCAEEHCSKYKARLDECNDRVNSKTKTTETCLEEVMDFYHCVDHCAGPKIFAKLKWTFFFLEKQQQQQQQIKNVFLISLHIWRI